jgi:septal ring factor EnvC (AmiA/AmiB activator)
MKSAAAEVRRAEKALAVATKRRDGLERDRDRLAMQLAQIDDELAAAHTEVDHVEAQLDEAVAEMEAAGEIVL